MSKKIYKFTDHRDFDSAYVVAMNEKQATEFMKLETELEVTLSGERPIDDFPRADLNRQVPYFYKNNIELF